jgi:cytochrome c5
MTNRALSFVFIAAIAAVAACGFPKTGAAPAALTPAQITAATAATPGVSEQSLTAGHDAFISKCNGCHGYPDLASVPAEKWPDVMKRMSGKAELKGPQSDDVLHYVLAARAEPVKAP